MTQFSVPTTSGTVSVIWIDANYNTSGLTATGSLNTCPMGERQSCIFNVPTTLLGCIRPHSLDLDTEDPTILGLKASWRLFVNLAQHSVIDIPNFFQLHYPDTHYKYIKVYQQRTNILTVKSTNNSQDFNNKLV